MKYFVLILTTIFVINTHANYLDENLHLEKWGGVDIVWLEDESLPTYDVTVYFSQGAFSDNKSRAGELSLMFNQLTSGTKRFSREQIVESLEFYGTSYDNRVTHEFSTFSVSGLVKDFTPTMKMVCHLFNDSTFPKEELSKTKKLLTASLTSLVSNHRELATRAFRNESLKGSGYETPTEGTLKTIKKIQSKHLKGKLNFLNKNVYKRIYIKGPDVVKQFESIVKNDCHWGEAKYQETLPEINKSAKTGKIIFVPVPNANQAQVQIGRILRTNEIKKSNDVAMKFASNFLGGGFTSRLIQKLRVELGLTYSAGAYVSEQKTYGRSGIATFTKNETIIPLLSNIKSILHKAQTDIEMDTFTYSKRNLKGNYLLSLESTSDFLGQLLMLDHTQKAYSEIYKFPEALTLISKEQLQKQIKEIFNWDDQTVVILGSKKLISVLKKAGYKVEESSYKQYL